MKISIAILAALLASGCAQTYYAHPSQPASSFEAEKYECQIEAERRASDRGVASNPLVIRDFMRECFKHRGWQIVQGESK